jgi:TusA-related sulfurtransferase
MSRYQENRTGAQSASVHILGENTMRIFKTLDIRGLSFFSASDKMAKAFKGVTRNGILEIILDKKKNVTEAFQQWAEARGYSVFNRDEDPQLVRLFIKKENG